MLIIFNRYRVNGNDLTKASFSSWLTKGEYYLCGSSDQYIKFSADSFEVNDQIVIKSTGYKDLTLKVTGTGKQWAVEKVTSQSEPEQTKDAPTFVGDQVEISYTDYKIIKPADEILILITSVNHRNICRWDKMG